MSYLCHFFCRTTLNIGLALALAYCSSNAPQEPLAPVVQVAPAQQTSALDTLRQLADSSSAPESQRYLLDIVDLHMAAGASSDAQATLSEIDDLSRLPGNLQLRYALAAGSLALQRGDADAALSALNAPSLIATTGIDISLSNRIKEMRADAYLLARQFPEALRERISLTFELDAGALAANNNAIWEILSSAPAEAISSIASNVDSYELRGWLELLRLVNSNQYDIQTQMSIMDQWRNTWAQHSASSQLPGALSIIYDSWALRPQEIGLVLPIQEALGKAISEGFLSAYYDALSKGRDVPIVRIYDSSSGTDVLALYDQAIEDGVDMVIGPLLKDAVRRMQRSSSPMPVPTLALNYGDAAEGITGDLFQFGLAPEDEIMQAADTAWAAGHRNAAILTPTGEDYQRIQDTFISYWISLGGRIVANDSFSTNGNYTPVVKNIFSIDASEARAAQIRSLLPRANIEFVPRRRQDVDFIFLLANPGEGREIKPTLSFHFAGDVPVYAMPAIYDGSNNIANRDLNGVIFNDAPWILENTDPLKTSVASTWAPASGPVQRLRAMGIDAYRLYLRLEQLHRFPYTRVAGATGTLTMKADGGIRRTLHNAVMIDGSASLLPN